MKTDKKHKFHVPDLKLKVMTLEAVFGEKFMRAQLNPRTVDKWLNEPQPKPYLTSLKRYFMTIGVNESDMLKGKNELSLRVAEICSKRKENQQYSVDDIISIYDSLADDTAGVPSVLLEQTLKNIQKETVKNDYLYLKGWYHMYHYWNSSDKKALIRRNLVSIYDLDEQKGLMRSQISISPLKTIQADDRWVYDGWVFNIKNKLFWLFECVKGMLPEIVTFHVFKPAFWPEPDQFLLHGILSALSLQGIPCAAGFILNKIVPDDPLAQKTGYFTADEIASEHHPIDILSHIDSTIVHPKTI